jgi:hypothetical protein
MVSWESETHSWSSVAGYIIEVETIPPKQIIAQKHGIG